MGTRRSHTKSKNGCSQCKFRRIKCNEVAPVCQNCARRKIECDFSRSIGDRRSSAQGTDSRNSSESQDHRHNSSQIPHGTAATTATTTTTTTTTTTPSPSVIPIDPFLLPNLESTRRTTDLATGDLELLHHYSTVTYATLADASASADNRELWQVHAVRLGFKHEFLLRAILTVAALHLRHLNPLRSSYYDLMASTHQNFALESAREALTRVTEDNCHAIFTFSCLIVIMTSASLRKQAGIEAHQEILEWFFLLRGCNSVAELHWETLRTSFLYPLLEGVSTTQITSIESIKDADRILELLTTCCYSDATGDPEVSKAYAMTIYELVKVFSEVSVLREKGQGQIFACYIWPTTVPQKYLELLKDQKPRALVILAHYAVLLHWVDNEWFVRGMARYLLDAIKSSVGEQWHGALQWPSSVIGSDSI